MTRPLKFRAWDKVDKQMSPGVEWLRGLWGLLDFQRFTEDQHPEKGNAAERFVLMQFTGLLDKNGKEIYEGDVIETGFAPVRTCKVEWTERVAAFYPFYTDAKAKEYEVIGNVWETPELLK